MEFLNPWMLAGIAGAAAPVVVHLLHKRKQKRIDWGAMRFLHALLAKRRRQLMLNQFLLLLLRVAIICCVALALARPAWRSAASGGDAIERQGRVGAVIAIDDSLSSGRGRGETVFEQQRALALAYLDTLSPGDEISILTSSGLAAPIADPLYDLDAARALVEALEPTAVSSDLPGLLDGAVRQLDRGFNPHREVVLIDDGVDHGWFPERRQRWSALNSIFAGKGPEDNQHPHLLRLAPSLRSTPANLAVINIEADRTLIPADTDIGLTVSILATGEDLPDDVLVRLLAGDRVVDERPLGDIDTQRRDLVFTHHFAEPGSHAVSVELIGARDGLPTDDRRSHSLLVRDAVPVVLVEPEAESDRPIFERPLGLVEASLDPRGDGTGLFAIQRLAAADLAAADLDQVKVVILGDVVALDADAVAALERFAVAGGGILVGLGPDTDLELINRTWARSGDGFLPAPLAEATDFADGSAPVSALPGHPVLRAFSGAAAQEWRQLSVRRAFDLDLATVADRGLLRLLDLDGGHPLLVARERGLGRVLLWTSSFDLDWADNARSPFVPLVRGAVAWLAGSPLPPRNLRPGDQLVHLPSDRDETVSATGPDGDSLELSAGDWQGRAMVASEPIATTGLARVDDPAGVVHYAFAPAAGESALAPLADETRSRALGRLAVPEAQQPEQVAQLVDAGAGNGAESWTWLVLAAAVLAVIESWYTRRLTFGERGHTTVASSTVEEPRRAA